jgi:hypothetical protein
MCENVQMCGLFRWVDQFSHYVAGGGWFKNVGHIPFDRVAIHAENFKFPVGGIKRRYETARKGQRQPATKAG